MDGSLHRRICGDGVIEYLTQNDFCSCFYPTTRSSCCSSLLIAGRSQVGGIASCTVSVSGIAFARIIGPGDSSLEIHRLRVQFPRTCMEPDELRLSSRSS